MAQEAAAPKASTVVDSLDYRRFDALAAECDSDEEAAPGEEPAPPEAARKETGKGLLPRDAAGNVELDNADLPPLFWDSMPENADEHPDKVALDALLEEDTPEERADTLKVTANC